jgi:hypothetical protein
MTLRRIHLQRHDGYTTPPVTDDDIRSSVRRMFLVEGYCESNMMGFYTAESGFGDTEEDALQSAYDKIANRLCVGYRMSGLHMKITQDFEFNADDAQCSGSMGFAWFRVDAEYVAEFGEMTDDE